MFFIFSMNMHGLFLWQIKKGITVTNAFQKILDESSCKPNKIWVHKGIEFYNKSMKSWLEKDAIVMNSTHNKEKSVVAERFIRVLKNKIDKYRNSIQKISIYVYTDNLDYIVYRYTYYSTNKMKPVDVIKNVMM